MIELTSSAMESPGDWLLHRPALLRVTLNWLRRRSPVLKLGDKVLVLGHGQVADVLERPDEFGVRDLIADGLEFGDFMLGLDSRPQHDREKSHLNAATYGAADALLQRVEAIARVESNAAIDDALAKANPTCTLDIVADLADRVAGACVMELFLGLDVANMPLAARAALIGHLRALGIAAIAGRKTPASKQAKDALDKAMGAVATPPPNSVTDRLCKAHVGPNEIKRNVTGAAMAGSATVARAMAQVVDELMRRPDVLGRARRDVAADPTCFAAERYALEALRFNPLFPFVQRRCMEDARISRGPQSAIAVTKGDRVFVSLLSAMLDETAVTAPDDFRLDRDPRHSLVFGLGMHDCFGREIAKVQMRVMLQALLTRSGELKRVSQLTYDGYAAVSMRVSWPTP